jgi:hypothetical protein
VPREPDAGQDVDLEEPLPFGVRDLEDGRGGEDARVVDEDVDVGHLGDQGARAPCRADVRGDAADQVRPGLGA